jgi:oligopeptide transport system permease protein
MELFEKIWDNIKFWLKILFVILILVTYPRSIGGPNSHNLTATYGFQSFGFLENIAQMISSVWNEHTLGTTRYSKTVEEELLMVVPRSLKIMIPAFILSMLFGVLKGVYDYLSQYKKRGIFGHTLTWIIQAIPDFFIILLIQYGVILLMRNGFPKVDIYGHEHWYNLILPILFLSLYPTAYIARVTSSTLAEQEGNEYLLVARSKGMSHLLVTFKHALMNCWATILSHATSIMFYILSNLFIVEYLLFYKGAAYRMYEALGGPRVEGAIYFGGGIEGPLVVGFILVFLLIILITQILSQIGRYYADPRLRG